MRKPEPKQMEDWSWSDQDLTPKNTPIKKVLGVLGALLVFITIVTILAMNLFPFQYEHKKTTTKPKPTPAQLPIINPQDTIASKTLQSVINTTPDKLNGLGVANVGDNDVQTLPGLMDCPKITPTPAVVSFVKGWSGGNWMNPSGYTLTLNAYQAGVGYPAMKQLLDASCSWLDVHGDTQKATGTITNGNETTSFTSIRLGDVIATVTATNKSIPTSFVSMITKTLQKDLKPVCTDMVENSDQSARNPYYSKDKFTGWLKTETVPAAQPYLQEVKQPASQNLPDVTLPSPPDDPYYPTSLPSPVAKPTAPTVPYYPATSQTIQYRQDDPTGPGCGWTFTGLSAPVFNQNDADNSRNQQYTSVQAGLKKNLDAYANNVQKWQTTWNAYLTAATSYQAYVSQVNDVASQWQKEKEAQQQYKDALDAYNESVQTKANFDAQKANAQTQYENDQAVCQAYSTAQPTPSVTMVTPDPSVSMYTVYPTAQPTTSSPTSTATSSDSSTPAQTTAPETVPSPYVTSTTIYPQPVASTTMVSPTAPIACPPEEPSILNESEPTVIDSPTPPADPRPSGAR